MRTRTFDPGAILARSYRLADGSVVRLRLARLSDAAGIAALTGADELTIKRLLMGGPLGRVTICATKPVAGTEALVGAGSLRVGREPDMLAAVPEQGPELEALIEGALRAHGRHLAARAA